MKNIKYILVAVLLTGSITSCKKQINLEPKNATYDEVFWSNGDNAESALAGAYAGLRSSISAFPSGYDPFPAWFLFGDYPTDQFLFGYWNFQDISRKGRFKFSYAPYLENVLWNWSNFYAVINQCHLVAENVPGIPDNKFAGGAEQKKSIIAQAKFLRAYTYFYITRVWGDAVLTKESLKDPASVQPLPRTPESEVIDYCIQDAKEAVDFMEYTGEKVKADKGAAQALLAHLYAWKHDYANAEKYCDEIINSGAYNLENTDNISQIWQPFSSESIFEINMQYDQRSNEATGHFFATYLFEPVLRTKSAGDAWLPDEDLVFNLYDTAVDARFKQAFTLGNDDILMLTKYANVLFYDDNQRDNFVVNNNLIVYRLADILLLKAEAASKQGKDGEALLALNQVRNRAGLDDATASGEDLFYEILDERRREMFGEGTLAYDFIRMEVLGYLFSDIYSPDRIAGKGYYWPIDLRKYKAQNPLITQNEWWKNH